MRCGWCGSANAGGTNCVNCGGPLPDPGSAELGPGPPEAPRSLPSAYVRRVLYTQNFGVVFGSVFGGIGAVICLVFVPVSFFMPPMLLGVCIASIFPIVGFGIGFMSWSAASRRLETLRLGRAAVGRVSAIDLDRTVSINNQHPWRLTYVFDLGDERHSGSTSSFDAGITKFAVGNPIHVVYLPHDPSRNGTWPLLA